MSSAVNTPTRGRGNGNGGERGSLHLVAGRRSHRDCGTVDPARLDEVPFEDLVCRLALGHAKGRDARGWSRLVEADLVVRTHAGLSRARARNASAMERRREDWIRYTEARVGVKVDAREWEVACQEYHDWWARAEKFAAAVAKALGEVERAQRTLARDNGGEPADPAFYRHALKCVAQAVWSHRAALEGGEVIAEDHGVRLWSVLDRVSVPHGPLSQEMALSALFDEQIWGVGR